MALDKISLFSLEVVVDKLHLPDITCRFPAVAFRLLDFPTLIIYHVEPDLAETIKFKISADPHYKIPKQLTELSDKHGDFPIKKGKSCLFKVSANTLQSHLSSTPLYVMIIDTYPEVPKLIGSCTIPIDRVMDNVYGDICKFGITVPTAHGERGEFSIFNLMGSEIGEVSLGMRFLSLGVGLMSHIPDNAIAKMTPSPDMHGRRKASEQEKKAQETADIILHDLEALDKPTVVSISPGVEVKSKNLQTEKDVLHNIATQTKKNKKTMKQEKNLHTKMVSHDEDDLFISNYICPPPLFYNSESEPQEVYQTLQFSNVQTEGTGFPNQRRDTIQEHDEESSDDDTIRPEDKYSESEFVVSSDQIARNIALKNDMQPKSKPTVTKSIVGPSANTLQHQQVTSAMQQLKTNLSQFPVLNALLQEIVNMQNSTVAPAAAVASPTSPKSSSMSPRRSTKGLFSRASSPKRGDTEIAASVVSTAATSPGRKSRHDCAQPPPAVPKNKSWIGNVPAEVRKTKLAYGMTNTQRMRLAKTNPHYLQTIERHEEERVKKRRAISDAKWGLRDDGMSTGPLDISTEISKHPYTHEVKMTDKREKVLKNKSSPFVPHLNLGRTNERPQHHHKKPVPTPRHSITALSMSYDSKDASILPPMTPRHQRSPERRGLQETHTVARPYNNELHDLDLESKSIEVHVPTASNDEDYAHSEATSQGWDNIYSPKHRTQTHDGKPKIKRTVSYEDEARANEANTYRSGYYSDDFEENDAYSPKDAAEELGLKRFVETRPEEDEDDTSNKLVGMEVGLRMIKDKYSDDDNSDSYHSVESAPRGESGSVKLKMGSATKMPKAPQSLQSPMVQMGQMKQPKLATRQPVLSSGEDPQHSMSPDSTAYIPRSQVPSQMSMDSTGSTEEDGNSWQRSSPDFRKPLPSPRSHKRLSVHTESLSSYLPSDPENYSPGPVSPQSAGGSPERDISLVDSDSYDYVPKVRSMKDMRVAPEAKLGYTWAGHS